MPTKTEYQSAAFSPAAEAASRKTSSLSTMAVDYTLSESSSSSGTVAEPQSAPSTLVEHFLKEHKELQSYKYVPPSFYATNDSLNTPLGLENTLWSMVRPCPSQLSLQQRVTVPQCH